MTTTAPEPNWPPVVCGARETRTDGNYECVREPVRPDFPHYFQKLNTGRRGA